VLETELSTGAKRPKEVNLTNRKPDFRAIAEKAELPD
jgi:hypothetical protein